MYETFLHYCGVCHCMNLNVFLFVAFLCLWRHWNSSWPLPFLSKYYIPYPLPPLNVLTEFFGSFPPLLFLLMIILPYRVFYSSILFWQTVISWKYFVLVLPFFTLPQFFLFEWNSTLLQNIIGILFRDAPSRGGGHLPPWIFGFIKKLWKF